MLRRHIDFIAVLFIAVLMAAFSHLGALKLPDFRDSVRFQNALVNADTCPIHEEVLSLLK